MPKTKVTTSYEDIIMSNAVVEEDFESIDEDEILSGRKDDEDE